MRKNKGAISAGIAIVLVLIGILVLGGLWMLTSYNSLVAKYSEVEKTSADIDTQLQRRVDLIPNLVNTVKGYASHEEEVFAQVNEARQNLLNANSMEEKAQANNKLDSSIGRLLAVAENYPELKADQVYIRLMDELAGTENRISYSREEYNKAVTIYNRKMRTIPVAFIASSFDFEEAEYFKAAEGAEVAPEVSFE